MRPRHQECFTMKTFTRATVILVLIWVTWAICVVVPNFPGMIFNGNIVQDKRDKILISLADGPVQGHAKSVILQDLFKEYTPNQQQNSIHETSANRTSTKKPEPVFVIKGHPNKIEDSGNGNDNVRVVKKNLMLSKNTAFRPPDTNLGNLPENKMDVIHMKREAAETRYYTLKTAKVNPVDHELLITGGQICDAVSPFLLIIIPSVPSHFSTRDVIRNTYGTFAHNTGKVHRKTNITLKETVKLVFLVGKGGNESTDVMLKNESRVHGDIVQADFVDSYYNLTRKMLLALKWTSIYCNEIDYFLKADEDVFVNVPVLVNRLKRNPYKIKGAIYGHLNTGSTVKRTGKWKVGWKEFPLMFYPPYVSGNSYVISGNIIPRLFMVSEYFSYMPIEDAFITGILARVIETNHVGVNGFTYWTDSEPNPCAFVRTSRISATNVDEQLMRKVWQALIQFDANCRFNVHGSNMLTHKH